jgi:hypothetical protein
LKPTVLEVSWFGAQSVSLPLGEAFHSRRLTIRSSQVGSIAAAQRSRWDYRRRMATVMDLLDDPALDALISRESPFADLPQIMAELSRNPGGALCASPGLSGSGLNWNRAESSQVFPSNQPKVSSCTPFASVTIS